MTTVDAIAEIRAVRHEEGHVRVAPGEVERTPWPSQCARPWKNGRAARARLT